MDKLEQIVKEKQSASVQHAWELFQNCLNVFQHSPHELTEEFSTKLK